MGGRARREAQERATRAPSQGEERKETRERCAFSVCSGSVSPDRGPVAAAEEAEDLTQEVEQGLVAFQTLLEYHTDIAFDFFEAWSLRNIFFIPPELERGDVVVLPHYEGADLTGGEGGTAVVDKQREMMDEIEELRKRLDEVSNLVAFLCLLAETDASNGASHAF